MFSSVIFRRIFLAVFGIVFAFSLAIYFFSVPLIKQTVYRMEEESANTILDNVYRLVQSEFHSIQAYKDSALEAYKRQLKNITLIQESFLRSKYAEYQKGLINKDVAMRSALEELRSFRYGNNDYLWVSNYESTLISHPDPKLHNADFSNVKDIYGNYIVPPMVAVARENGEGYTSYWWRRLGEEKPVRKLTYSRHFPEWNWVIGTGLYVDDVDEEVARRKEKVIEELREILSDIRIARTGYMYVFDSEMNMIIHPNSNIEHTNFSDLLNPVTGQPIGKELIRVAHSNDRHLDYKWDKPDDKGKYIYDKISWVRHFDGFNWFIASSVYKDELNQTAVALKNRTLLVSTVMLFLCIGAASVFLRKILVPVEELSDMAVRVKEGDLSARCTVGGKDEIGILAEAFNAMVARLRASIENLDKMVRERTSELDEKNDKLEREIAERKQVEVALQAAKENAEAANRSKGRFLANMSHEIRTPLNGIIGYSEIIIKSKSLERCQQQGRIILDQSEHLLRLINEILDHAKIEAGKLELDPRPLEIKTLMESVVSSAHIQAKKKGVELKSIVRQGVSPYVIGDSLRMRQILLNLVGNAIKFTGEGSVTLTVEQTETRKGIAVLRFSVTDTGVGIAKDKQAAVFERFTQADHSTTRKYGGTGLGITISRQLVTLMGGDMGLESEPGKGTTFWFNLPLPISEARSQSDNREKTAKDACAAGRGRHRTGHILLAEDYPVNQDVARQHLEGAGYSVTIAEDGEQAVNTCENERYDLILMDVQMPGLDGLEATRRIRSGHSPCVDVAILALTADADPNTQEACRKAGMNDVLTKPIRRHALLAGVDKWISVPGKGRKGCSEPPSDPSPHPTLDSGVPLDYEVASEEFGDLDTVEEVVDQFLKKVEAQIQDMKISISGQDIDALKRNAHSIKGGAATLEANPLSDVAKMMEDRCKTKDMDALPFALEGLIAEFDRLKAYVANREDTGSNRG